MLLIHFQLSSTTNVQSILSQIKKFAIDQNADSNLLSEIITIASELIYNVIKFSSEGEFSITYENNIFTINVVDNGKGFANKVEDAFKEGYSTAGSLGLGLPSIARMCDELEVSTSAHGTIISCKKEFF